VGKVFSEFDKTIVEVAGHTDSTGTDSYNQALSERRAGSVAAYLRSRKISGDRMITVGMGEARPIADNTTEAGRQLNRRVEITVVPLTAG
jgi:outer membrane protein OmpA-like peptidoglycan-associated protein